MADEDDDWIEGLASRLLEGGPREISLDEIGEELGERAVGPADVEVLLSRLEKGGANIAGSAGEGLVELLKQVIQTAHQLRATGKTASPRSIAEKSGLSVRAVRVALLYADVIKG